MATFTDDEDKLILFQCKNCNSIITDSSNSEGANAELGLLVLQDAPETLSDEAVPTRGKGDEEGCTYFVVHCSTCDATLGKYYETVSEDLAELADHAVLDLEQLKFYSVPLNSSKLSRSSLGDTTTREAEERASTGQGSNNCNLKQVRGDMQKIQYVMCHFDERIKRIEKVLRLPDIEEDTLEASEDTSVNSEHRVDYFYPSRGKDTFIVPETSRVGHPGLKRSMSSNRRSTPRKRDRGEWQESEDPSGRRDDAGGLSRPADRDDATAVGRRNLQKRKVSEPARGSLGKKRRRDPFAE